MPRRPQDPLLLSKFGARLRSIRDTGGLTQQRLADVLRVRAATISQIEAGGLSPTLTTIAALARALHVRLPDLMDFEGPPANAAPASAEESDLLGEWRKLPEARRRILLALVRDMTVEAPQTPRDE